MANWKKKIQLRDLLQNYDSSADELKEIKRIKPLWVERLNTIPDLKGFIPSLKKVRTEAGFNKWLNSIYDFCDANLIWIEL